MLCKSEEKKRRESANEKDLDAHAMTSRSPTSRSAREAVALLSTAGLRAAMEDAYAR